MDGNICHKNQRLLFVHRLHNKSSDSFSNIPTAHTPHILGISEYHFCLCKFSQYHLHPPLAPTQQYGRTVLWRIDSHHHYTNPLHQHPPDTRIRCSKSQSISLQENLNSLPFSSSSHCTISRQGLILPSTVKHVTIRVTAR